MNQTLKTFVYALGTTEQIEFLAKLGGMTDIEREFFRLSHEQKTDLYIMEELHISRKRYDVIYQSVRLKTAVAVFDCINSKMAEMEQK